MSEKFYFFKASYEGTLAEQEKLKSDFLNLAKIAPLFFAYSYFLYTKREVDFQFTGETINWFNLFLFLQFLGLVVFTIIVAIGFILPPKTKMLSSPNTLSTHWDELENHNRTYNISRDSDAAFKESILPQYINAATINDAGNIQQYRIKRYAGFALLIVICSSLVLILMMIVR